MALISFAVTAKLICVFVFAYADCWFSHEAAQMVTAEIPQSDLFESVAMLKFSVYRCYKKIGCKI